MSHSSLHLVTGGSGFLGSRLVRRLHDAGERVRVLDLTPDAMRPPGVEFIQGDIRDAATVAAAMRGVTTVHHHAAMVPLTKAKAEFHSVHVEGSRRLAEEAARAGVRDFLYLSSSAVFGTPKTCPVTKDMRPHPIEAYGQTKLAGEHAVQEVSARTGLRLFIFRPRTILGPGRLGIFEILFQWVAEHRRLYVLGDGSNRIQFVQVDDMVDACLLAVRGGAPGTYNVGTPRFGTLREDLAALCFHAGSRSRITSLPVGPAAAALRLLDLLGLSPLAPWHYLSYAHSLYFDVTPLLALGWQPRYSNQEMLCSSYDAYQQHRASGSEASIHRRPVAQRALGLFRRLS